jgi:hypothetical protein
MPNKSRPLFDCHMLIKPQIANSHTIQRSIPARPTRTRNQAMDAEATSPLLPVVQTAAALPVRFPRRPGRTHHYRAAPAASAPPIWMERLQDEGVAYLRGAEI